MYTYVLLLYKMPFLIITLAFLEYNTLVAWFGPPLPINLAHRMSLIIIQYFMVPYAQYNVKIKTFSVADRLVILKCVTRPQLPANKRSRNLALMFNL
jgi:hypothetical protein